MQKMKVALEGKKSFLSDPDSILPIRKDSAGRLYFLDNLKAAVMLMVIVHHAAMGYMSYEIPGWGIHDVDTSQFFDWFVAWDDAYIMPLMFFVSGYFGIGSAVKYSAAAYLRGKWFRIGWPWIVGVVFLAPVTFGVSHPDLLMDGVVPYLVGFWTKYFYPAQYWYLNILLWFYLLLLAAVKLRPRISVREKIPERPHRAFFGLMTLTGFGGMFLLNLWIPDSAWCTWRFLELQYVRAPLYLLFFFCGAWAWKKRWFQEDGYHPNWKIWLTLAGSASAAYVFLRWFLAAYNIEFAPLLLKLVDTSIRAGLSVVCSFAAIAVFDRFANCTNRVWARWGASAFAIYWIQQPVVTFFAKWSSSIEANSLVKFLLVVLATAAVSYLVSAFILIKLPFFATGRKNKGNNQ